MKINKENVVSLFETRFIKVFDLQYKEGKHYYDATRRSLDDLTCLKSDDDFKKMLPDAVTCIVILQERDNEPKLLMSKEYRYPTGHFLLSPPAGLIDAEDKSADSPLVVTAVREIKEETGIDVKPTDRVFAVNPCLFSTPGMTDESNALVCAVVALDDLSSLSQDGCVGSELFDGFMLLTKEDARRIINKGHDDDGIFYSVYTWGALMYFLSDMWK